MPLVRVFDTSVISYKASLTSQSYPNNPAFAMVTAILGIKIDEMDNMPLTSFCYQLAVLKLNYPVIAMVTATLVLIYC